MTNLTQSSKQWATRPDDERFTSLADLDAFCQKQKELTTMGIMSNRQIKAIPDGMDNVLIQSESGKTIEMTNHAFNQISTIAQAPASYLRTLPAPMVADCINYGLQFNPEKQMSVKVQQDEMGTPQSLRCATGPNYGTIWNGDITRTLRNKFENSDWTVPGEFGKTLDIVTKENTTLYASDRDMFVFLADEKNRIEIPNRRDGKTGSLARGFFLWNSEVGDKTCGIGFFLFDYACKNRTVWGAEQFREVKIRHTSGAPDRWLEEITPVLRDYSESSGAIVERQLLAAQNTKVSNVFKFLAERFTKTKAETYITAFKKDENREPETLWDITTGMTAYARSLSHTDNRIEIEKEAGRILSLAS